MSACSGRCFLFISGKLTIHEAFRCMLMIKTGVSLDIEKTGQIKNFLSPAKLMAGESPGIQSHCNHNILQPAPSHNIPSVLPDSQLDCYVRQQFFQNADVEPGIKDNYQSVSDCMTQLPRHICP